MNMPDLDAYFARIGHTGSSQPTLDLLHELVARHLAHIPFESLDPLLGVPVDLDPAALQEKLVRGRRGGYCQEHNALFHDVLSALGYAVAALGGRVVWAFKGERAPLTHRLTLVEVAEGSFIADVGFGGQSPPAPLRLEPELEQRTPHGTYRIGREGDVFELQLRVDGRWETMYEFTLAPHARMDFEVANWFTSTHPRSLFTQNLVASRIVGETRVNLQNDELAIRRPDGTVERRVLTDADELRRVLEEAMGLELPVAAETIWAKAVRRSVSLRGP
jgi:N-hydroxyarylamine O-acetyltransferase